MLIHSVYFWLKPDLTKEQRALFDSSVATLAKIKSVEKCYIGKPAQVPDRPVVDKSFSVNLVVVCKDVAAHDAYQIDPIHLAFVDKCKTFWSQVKIYDAQ